MGGYTCTQSAAWTHTTNATAATDSVAPHRQMGLATYLTERLLQVTLPLCQQGSVVMQLKDVLTPVQARLETPYSLQIAHEEAEGKLSGAAGRSSFDNTKKWTKQQQQQLRTGWQVVLVQRCGWWPAAEQIAWVTLSWTLCAAVNESLLTCCNRPFLLSSTPKLLSASPWLGSNATTSLKHCSAHESCPIPMATCAAQGSSSSVECDLPQAAGLFS